MGSIDLSSNERILQLMHQHGRQFEHAREKLSKRQDRVNQYNRKVNTGISNLKDEIAAIKRRMESYLQLTRPPQHSSIQYHDQAEINELIHLRSEVQKEREESIQMHLDLLEQWKHALKIEKGIIKDSARAKAKRKMKEADECVKYVEKSAALIMREIHDKIKE